MLDEPKDDSLADEVFALMERARAEGAAHEMAVLGCLFVAMTDGSTAQLAHALRPYALRHRDAMDFVLGPMQEVP